MARIWQDNRTDEQRQAAQDRADQRRDEWDAHHAANPTRVVIVNSGDRDDR